MKISGNMDVSSKRYVPDKVKENGDIAAVEQKSVNNTTGVTLESKSNGSIVRTEEELNSIIEDLAKQENPVKDADEMIRQANLNILNNSNDAVLAQANSSSERVAELLY